MLISAFLKGASLAFYIVVPIGALSVIYIKRVLQKGLLSGIISSLGVVTCEVFYAFVAIYSISFISDFLIEWRILLQSLGVIMMLIIGFKAIFTKIDSTKNNREKDNSVHGLINDFISMLFLAAFNPLTIFGFVAVFTSFGAHEFIGRPLIQMTLLFGFFSMSFCYTMLLVFVSFAVKNKFQSDKLKIVVDAELIEMLHKISGIVIILFTLLSFFISLINN